MGVPGFKSVAVPYDHQVAVAAGVVFGIAYPAVESGVNRFPGAQRNIYAVVVSPAAGTVFRQYFTGYRGFELGQVVHQFQFHHGRQVVIGDVPVGEYPGRIPMLRVDGQRIESFERWTVVGPGVVAEQNYLGLGIASGDCVQRAFGQVFQFRGRRTGSWCASSAGLGRKRDGETR